jgi:hypothetical protein
VPNDTSYIHLTSMTESLATCCASNFSVNFGKEGIPMIKRVEGCVPAQRCLWLVMHHKFSNCWFIDISAAKQSTD